MKHKGRVRAPGRNRALQAWLRAEEAASAWEALNELEAEASEAEAQAE